MSAETKGGRELRLCLVFEMESPVAQAGEAVSFGLQDKHHELSAGKIQADGSVRYECVVAVRPSTDGQPPRFSGPYAHGTPGDPFLYLSWRRASGGTDWIRRLKVPLGASRGSKWSWSAVQRRGGWRRE
ncbi:MAG: DUF5990 family protein [Chloroflexota bacterium]|nr:DUF5990 family protein [Chloroflexota bacterium]